MQSSSSRMVLRKRKMACKWDKQQIPHKTRRILATTEEEEVEKEDGEEAICWIDRLPSELLVKIFENLNIRERLRAEIVSQRWRRILSQESWRHFRQCRLSKNYSYQQLLTLSKRCGKYLRQVILAQKSAQEKSCEQPIPPMFDFFDRLPHLDSICIVHQQLNYDDFWRMAVPDGEFASRIRCLHIEGCSDKEEADLTPFLVENYPSLRYLSLIKSSKMAPYAHIDQAIEAKNVAQIRQLKLDRAFHLVLRMPHIAPTMLFPQLIGLCIAFTRHEEPEQLNYRLSFMTKPGNEEMFRRLQQFELAFSKRPDQMGAVKGIIPWLANIRLLSLSHIDGEILTEVVRHCAANLEQFEFLSHMPCIFNAFSQICRLKKLRVLSIRHYNEGAKTPKEMADGIIRETLWELASNGKLEHLSVNFKLPTDLVLHIVRENVCLDYLECGQSQREVTLLASTLEELGKTRPNRRPLHLRIPYNEWWKRRHAMKQRNPHQISLSNWLKLRHQPPNRETAVMREHLRRVFHGCHVPEFLVSWPKSDD